MQRKSLLLVLLHWDILELHFPRVHSQGSPPPLFSLIKPTCWANWLCLGMPGDASAQWSLTTWNVFTTSLDSQVVRPLTPKQQVTCVQRNRGQADGRPLPHPTKRQWRRSLWQESFLPGRFIMEVNENTKTFSDTHALRKYIAHIPLLSKHFGDAFWIPDS